MKNYLSIDKIYNEARTWTSFYTYQEKPVPNELLSEIYNLAKMGPTSGNCCPLRIYFVQSEGAKQKLLNCVMEGNVEAVKSSPVTAIFAYDIKFHEKMDYLFPTGKALREAFATNDKLAFDTAFRNSSLQAAYFILAARSKGLATGPMSGFDPVKLEKEFFGDNPNLKVNFICNLGYAKGEPKYPRLPRLDFEDACKIV